MLKEGSIELIVLGGAALAKKQRIIEAAARNSVVFTVFAGVQNERHHQHGWRLYCQI